MVFKKYHIGIISMIVLSFFLLQLSPAFARTTARQTTINTDSQQVEAALDAMVEAETLNPVEGEDINVLPLVQKIVDKVSSGVKVTVYKSANSAINKSGAITYGNNEETGKVTFKVTKNRASEIQAMMVVVPSETQSDPDIQDVASAKAALADAGTLYPVEGVDTNVVEMAQEIVDETASGVTVDINSSNNSQVTSNGSISYGDIEAAGNVTFALIKNEAMDTQRMPVIVPARIEADPDIQDVASAKAALANAGTLHPVEGVDTNVIEMAQEIVDGATSGVTVDINSSNNSQVTSDGSISYGNIEAAGNVTFALIKNEAMDTQRMPVIVPARIEADSDIQDVASAKAALVNAGTLYPVEGVDTNVVEMAQEIVDGAASGVTVDINSSNNSQVTSDGSISYGNIEAAGNVTFALIKNEAMDTQTMSVIVPARIEADPDKQDVASAKAALVNSGTLYPVEGVDTNVVEMSQEIVDGATSGVTVDINSSNNSQVAADGTIIYSSLEITGNVVIILTKNGIVDSLDILVVIPAQERMDIFSVKDYGAIGDGKTDDTAAIQRAIDDAADNGGGTVLFPSGRYLVLNVEAKAKVNLIGENATLIKNHGNDTSSVIQVNGSETGTYSSLARNSTAGDTAIYLNSSRGFNPGDYVVIVDDTYKYDGCGKNQEFGIIESVNRNAVTLTEGTIGSYETASSAMMIKLESAHDITIDGLNVEIPRGTRGGGINCDLAYNVLVRDCKISGAENMGGITFYRSAYAEIDGNTIKDGQDLDSESGHGYGFVFGESSHNCTAQNNYTYNIRENMITDNARCCSFINNEDVYAYNNSFNTHGTGCENILIANNISRDCRVYGITIGYEGSPAYDSYITVKGNKIYNSASQGILCMSDRGKEANHIEFINNEVYNPAIVGDYAIEVSRGNDIVIRQNSVVGGSGTWRGIGVLYCNRVEISNNDISDIFDEFGIVWDTCDSVLIDGNTLSQIDEYNLSSIGKNCNVTITNNVTDDSEILLEGDEYLAGNTWG